MSPRPDRWRPRRAGIINLYEYSDQVFDFAGGRLLLRGHNTSGKTKALELLLPFCLDGDISPNKLDPFGAAYKDMKWNLVGCTDDEKRVGYVWIEFERLDAAGALQRLTAGIGMRGQKSLPNVTRWHFIVRNREIGKDLHLLRGREPINRAELSAALGEDGEVLDSQRDYRARLADLLFSFSGEEQYQTMLRLMRDLRRPHLSKTLDPDRVAAQLTIGLPTVDEELMRKLAGGLEQIETLERGLNRLRGVRDQVRRFHQRTYSAYARAVVRERAEAIRQAQTGVDSAADQLRSTRAELERQRAVLAESTAARDAAETASLRLTAERDALITSKEWSSVAEVEAIRAHAATQRGAADAARAQVVRAAESATTAAAEEIAATAAAESQREVADADVLAAQQTAAAAGLGARTDEFTAQLRSGAMTSETWLSLIRETATDWRDVLHRHRELIQASLAARRAAERAREAERTAADRLEQAGLKTAAALSSLESAQASLADAIDRWRAGLTELQLNDEDVSDALELALSGQAPSPALTTAIDRRRQDLADQTATRQARRTDLEAQIRSTESEIDALAAARDEGPAAPERTRSSRSDRAGAALWRLVDFQPDLTAMQRAACEAALEASGLLDAWVMPDGRLTDTSLIDVVARTAESAPGPTLLDALVPVPDQPVDVPVITTLLASIALGEQTGRSWIGLDGRFSLGPLAGRGSKDSAEHIGASARQARRERRIAELRERIHGLRTDVDRLGTELAALDERRARLDAEIRAIPPVDEVTSARRAHEVTTALEARAASEHEAASVAAREAADAEVAADATRREHAATHGLAPALSETALDQLREANARLQGDATTAARAWQQAEREVAVATATTERAAQLKAAAAADEERARREEAEADRLETEYATRNAALGSTGDALRQRHEQVLSDLKQAQADHKQAGEDANIAGFAVHDLERDSGAQDTAHEAARSHREVTVTGIRQLGQTGLLDLVLGQDALPDGAEAGAWTLTRAIEVARQLPADLFTAKTSSGERGVEVQRQVQLLDRELAEADMGAYAVSGEDELLVVRITEGGIDRSLPVILDSLTTEIEANEQVLSAEERRVFNDALVEEIADHLRQRIHGVRGTLERMNAVLRHSPTAAGKRVELDWQPVEDDAGTHRAAMALIRREVRHLDATAREELIGFFRSRIDTARREHAWADQPQPMADTLMRAFDYRAWFAFGLWERSESGRVRLTRRRHAVGSGGEQSVLIHLPLFAAAAALYGDGPGPRLIMLDEALSGIDDETRERVLKATVDFDLDVMMTSHELWGTYASVPQLAIYQLHRENGQFGVHAIPFLWDGELLRELEQGELLV